MMIMQCITMQCNDRSLLLLSSHFTFHYAWWNETRRKSTLPTSVFKLFEDTSNDRSLLLVYSCVHISYFSFHIFFVHFTLIFRRKKLQNHQHHDHPQIPFLNNVGTWQLWTKFHFCPFPLLRVNRCLWFKYGHWTVPSPGNWKCNSQWKFNEHFVYFKKYIQLTQLEIYIKTLW